MPTAITRYVNTASSGGNGTTNATSGANAAYATLSAWRTAEAKNLVTADEAHTVWCTGGQDTLSADLDLTTFTTDTTRTLTINSTDVRSSTTFADGYRLTTSTAGVNIIVCSNLTINNIRASASWSSGTNDLIRVGTAAAITNLTISNCWLRNTGTATATVVQLYDASDNSSVTIYNCIFDSTNTSGTNRQVGIFNDRSAGTTALNVYNCTFYGFNTGSADTVAIKCDGTGAAITVKNCVIAACSDDVAAAASGTITPTYCAGEDAEFTSGTGNIQITAGTWSTHMTDPINGDYTVKAGSSLIGAGLDNPGSFSTDIAGVTRSDWDIGAFEYVAPSGLTITSVNTTNTAFSAQTDSAVIGAGLSASVVCTYAGIACANESASSSTSLKITFPNFFTNNIKLGRDYEFKVVG